LNTHVPSSGENRQRAIEDSECARPPAIIQQQRREISGRPSREIAAKLGQLILVNECGFARKYDFKRQFEELRRRQSRNPAAICLTLAAAMPYKDGLNGKDLACGLSLQRR
jgi:hypothetical protein